MTDAQARDNSKFTAVVIDFCDEEVSVKESTNHVFPKNCRSSLIGDVKHTTRSHTPQLPVDMFHRALNLNLLVSVFSGRFFFFFFFFWADDGVNRVSYMFIKLQDLLEKNRFINAVSDDWVSGRLIDASYRNLDVLEDFPNSFMRSGTVTGSSVPEKILKQERIFA